MKEVIVKLIRPLTGEVMFHTELTLPEQPAALVEDWIAEWLPKFLDRAIALHSRIEIKTRELGKQE